MRRRGEHVAEMNWSTLSAENAEIGRFLNLWPTESPWALSAELVKGTKRDVAYWIYWRKTKNYGMLRVGIELAVCRGRHV